jgi:hypothetical protein
MVWVSQAYAACCGPRGGTHQQSMPPVVEMHAMVPSTHGGCADPQEPCCPQTLGEKLPVTGGQPGVVDDGRLAQPAALQRSPPMLFEPHRAGNDRIPVTPDPPDRVYLLLQRLLI